MSLVSNITTIVNTLYPDSQFVLSSKFNANIDSYLVEIDKLPIIILDNELSKQVEIKKNNNIIKDTKILISIFFLDSVDNTDAQSQVLQEQAELIADRIANNIYQLENVRPNGNQKYKITPLFHFFSSNMTGVALEMNVNYNQIINICKI